MVVNELILLIIVPLIISLVNIFLPTIVRKILTFFGLVYLLYLNFILFNTAPTDISIMNETVLSIDKMAFFSLAFIQILSFAILIFSLKAL